MPTGDTDSTIRTLGLTSRIRSDGGEEVANDFEHRHIVEFIDALVPLAAGDAGRELEDRAIRRAASTRYGRR